MAIRNGPANARLGFRVLNVTPTEADLDIFDVVGDPWDGTTASDFVKQLRDLKNVQQLNVHINSPGGYVNDGLAIYNALQQHPANVTAYIESQAASIASVIAMAANKIVIAKNAQMFIHDAHGFGMGNAADMRNLADILDEESQNIASIYADRTGKSPGDWRKAMQANEGIGTGYRGQAAVDAGLADELMAPAKPMSTQSRQPMRIAALVNQMEPASTTIAACMVACVSEAITDMAQDWLEDEAVTMEQFLSLSALSTEISSTLSDRLTALGLADVAVGADDDEDDPTLTISMDLIPPLANGYEPPLPTDFTRLLEANMQKGHPANV